MKNNYGSKRIVKSVVFVILSAFLSLLVAVGLFIGGVFGFRAPVEQRDVKTVTITYGYVSKVSTLEKVCEESFKESGVKYVQKNSPEANSYNEEIVYYFNAKKVSDEKMTEIVSALKEDIKAEQAENGKLQDTDIIDIAGNSMKQLSVSGLPQGYGLRAAIALTVFSVLAFLYVALRYRLSMGLSMYASLLATVVMTVGLVGLFRFPVTASFGYALVIAALATVVLSLITFNRFRDNAKDKEKQKGLSSTEKVEKAISRKPMIIFAATLTAAFFLVGVLVPTARAFAWVCFVGLLCASYASFLLCPAVLVVADKVIKTKDRPTFQAKKKSKKQKAKAAETVAVNSVADNGEKEAEVVVEEE